MYIHPSALVEEGAIIGSGTRVWHLVQVRPGAKIGEDCIIGRGVFVDSGQAAPRHYTRRTNQERR